MLPTWEENVRDFNTHSSWAQPPRRILGLTIVMSNGIVNKFQVEVTSFPRYFSTKSISLHVDDNIGILDFFVDIWGF